MYLYKNKEDSFDVYIFKAKDEDLIKYRKEQMKRIVIDQCIYHADIEVNNDNNLVFNPNNQRFRLKHSYVTTFDRDNLLSAYYYGQYVNNCITQVEYLNALKYYLLTSNQYNNNF